MGCVLCFKIIIAIKDTKNNLYIEIEGFLLSLRGISKIRFIVIKVQVFES